VVQSVAALPYPGTSALQVEVLFIGSKTGKREGTVVLTDVGPELLTFVICSSQQVRQQVQCDFAMAAALSKTWH
jgi:hypothetical protein